MNKINTWLLWGNLFALAAGANIWQWRTYATVVNSNPASFEKAGIDHSEAQVGTASSADGKPFGRQLPPAKLTWDALEDVTYRKKWNKEMQMNEMYPVFGEKVKKLQGKDLYITGFIIPLNLLHGSYAISENPFASCFFCGRSGPESVIALKFKNEPMPYEIDEHLTMRGTMALNDTSVNDFIYMFKDAEEYNN